MTADPLEGVVRGQLAGLDGCPGTCDVQTQQGHQRSSQCYIINVASREDRLTFSQGFLFVLDELSVKYGRASFQRLLILVSFAM